MTPRQLVRAATTLVNLAARLTPDPDRRIAMEGRRILDVAAVLFESGEEPEMAADLRETVRKMREVAVKGRVRHRSGLTGLGRQRPENWNEQKGGA